MLPPIVLRDSIYSRMLRSKDANLLSDLNPSNLGSTFTQASQLDLSR